ncbi:STAS domain-containing protein [Nonomuraea sp. NPDC050310]|uniref:STAS domain-containing protein n=1 Tax=unclassified Nonomuraea TaxID=2593643 RepID=UPI0033D755B7
MVTGIADRPSAERDALPVRGEIDLVTAPVIEALVSHATALGRRRILLDLAGVTFMDASGLNALVRAANHAGRNGARVELVGVPPRVAHLLRLTGLHRRFTAPGATAA